MKYIQVTKSSMPSLEEYIAEIEDLWESRLLTNMGVKHQRLELNLKEYLKVDNISLFSNGHMALELAIQALELKGEVITTPFTFASTTHAIVRNGLTPVFCDINEEDFTMDVTKIEGLITDRTSAILPVHVYGNVCNVDEIQKIADKYGLKVIYDAAHSFGCTYKNQGIGSFGDVSMFSFHATKVYHTIEGGAITMKDPNLGLTLYRLKNFGIRGPEVVDWVGCNAKMNEFQAAMGICNLRHIDYEIEKRKSCFEYYLECLSGIRGIKLPKVQENVVSNYAYFPVVINEIEFGASRDEIYIQMVKKGIYARKYFYPLTSTYDCFHGKYDTCIVPVALHISKRVLTLPLYADMEISEIERVCEVIISMNSVKRYEYAGCLN